MRSHKHIDFVNDILNLVDGYLAVSGLTQGRALLELAPDAGGAPC